MYHGMNLCYITNNLSISQMVFHFPSKYQKRFSFFFSFLFYRFSGCVENCLGDVFFLHLLRIYYVGGCLLYVEVVCRFFFLIYCIYSKSLNIPISVEMIPQIICFFFQLSFYFFFIGVKDGRFIIKGYFTRAKCDKKIFDVYCNRTY